MTLAELDNAIRLADGCTISEVSWACRCPDRRHMGEYYSISIDASMALIRRRWPDATVSLSGEKAFIAVPPNYYVMLEGATDAERLARALLMALEGEK